MPTDNPENDSPRDNPAMDGMLRENARKPGGQADEGFINRVKRAIQGGGSSSPKGNLEPDLPWAFGAIFWKVSGIAAALIAAVLIVQTVQVSLAKADPTRVFVYTQPRVSPGTLAAIRVMVTDAAKGEPVANAMVRIQDTGRFLKGKIDAIRTNAEGIAEFTAQVREDLPEGEYTLDVAVRADTGKAETQQTVAIQRSYKTMLSTDKPLYQPGQIIHMRALSMENDTLVPAEGRSVAFEVQDAKGNKVFRKTIETSAFGIAAADFQLADQVNTGDYTLNVTIGDTTTSRTVKVDRYVLPKFKVNLTTDQHYYEPGQTLQIDLEADYTFGQPVAGAKVKIRALEFIERFRPFREISGKTDAQGQFSTQLELKNAFVGQALNQGDAFVQLVAEVTDATGETQNQTLQATVTNQPIRVEVFPESGELVRGVENTLYVVTAYPDGSPASCTISTGGGASLRTNEVGIGKFTVTPTTETFTLNIAASDNRGARARAERQLPVDQRTEGILLRTDRAVYKQGETSELTVLSASRARRVFLDVVKNGRSFLSTSIYIADGTGSYVLDLPPDLVGTVQLQSYAILGDGEIARDTKLIQVHRADALTIQAKLDAETYRPAEKALIQFLVTTKDGTPTEAALSLAAVDEAVFALNDSRPGLEAMYFIIQEELLKPRYQFVLPSPGDFTQFPDGEEPVILEANQVLAASADDSAQPAQAVSQTLETRKEALQERREDHAQARARLLGQVPFWAFVLFGCVFLSYFGFHATVPSKDTITGPTADEFRRQMGHLHRQTLLATLLTPILVVLLGLFLMRQNQVSMIVAFSVIAGIWTLVLAVKSFEIRKLPLTAKFPSFRRAIVMVPALFLLAVLMILGCIAAQELVWDSFNENMIMRMVLTTLGGLLLLVIAIRYLRVALVEARSRGGMLKALGWNLGIVTLQVGAIAGVLAALAAVLSPASKFAGEMEMMAADEGAIPLMEMFGANQFMQKSAPGGGAVTTTTAAGASVEPPRVRRFFPETLLWQPQLLTNAEGEAQLELTLADSITTWRLAGSAVNANGSLGSFQEGIRVFQDFFIDIDFPVALTQNDEVTVPIAIFNYLDRPREIRLEAKEGDWFEFVDDVPEKAVQAGAGAVMQSSYRIRAKKPGRHSLTVMAYGETLSDAVERSVTVTPDGERVETVINGRLEGNAKQSLTFPEDAIPGGSDLYLKIYPGAFSQVVEGMDSIFRMPYGCFEQTSSTTYPNVLVLDYLRRTKQAKPELEMKALDFIAMGYQRLLSYEVDGGGFEWFGQAPAHNVLTAYGLLEFVDMHKVYEIDEDVITRTRDWLLAQREGNGSWKPSQGGIAEGAINQFRDANAEAVLRTTAYLSWSIAEAGGGASLNSSFDYLIRGADASQDPYTLALIANAFLSADRRGEAVEILKQLAALQKAQEDLVYWEAGGSALTHGRGNAFTIETTALIAQALLRAKQDVGTAHKALEWLITQRDGGGTWHSTQATVQAMRALLMATDASGTVEEDVTVSILANGEAASPVSITEDNRDVFHLVSLTELLNAGENTIEIQPSQGANLAFQIVGVHYEPRKDGPEEKGPILEIDTDYSTTNLATDDLLTVEVTLRYHRPGFAPMTLVDLGVPPGFEIDAASFQQLVDQKVIQRFEPKARQVTLYFDTIPGGGKPTTFQCQLRAKFPVKAQAPASVAYQYYEPEVRDESEVVQLTVE